MITILNSKKIRLIAVILLAAILGGCSYSFTGASVPPHLKTIAIPFFKDRSNSGEPDLSETFTQQLIDKFMNDNTLTVEDKARADAVVECTIMPFQDVLSVISGGDQVSTRKITLTVKVVYRDLVKKKVIFEKNFSNNTDYDSQTNAVENRSAAIQTVIDLITEDILLGVVANW